MISPAILFSKGVELWEKSKLKDLAYLPPFRSPSAMISPAIIIPMECSNFRVTPGVILSRPPVNKFDVFY
jgi:hypothetical protein